MEALENLVRINKLRPEPPDNKEHQGMLASARRQLKDLQTPGLSKDGRFMFAYGASHTLALAALRLKGYRSVDRITVFQCISHTLGWQAKDWWILKDCHGRRNIAEYEGELTIEDVLLDELVATAYRLLEEVEVLDFPE